MSEAQQHLLIPLRKVARPRIKLDIEGAARDGGKREVGLDRSAVGLPRLQGENCTAPKFVIEVSSGIGMCWPIAAKRST